MAVRKSRFTEEQIDYALKQAETGMPVAEVLRRMGSRSRNSIAGRSSTAGLELASCGV